MLRAAVLVVSGIHQASIDADNEYATGALDYEWGIFERATAVPMEVMTAQIRHALRVSHPADTSNPDSPLIGGLDPTTVIRLDLSVESDAMDSGVWLDPDAEHNLASAAVSDGAAAVVTEFGQPRVTRSAPLRPLEWRVRRWRSPA